MKVEFKTIKEFGKWAVEITDEGDNKFNIIKFENKEVKEVISVTKEDIESMIAFINRNKKTNK